MVDKPNAKAEAPKPEDVPEKPRKVDVFYHPIHPGDPHTTTWHGHTFRAGQPVTVDPEAKSNKDLFDSLPGNKYFSCPDIGVQKERAHAAKRPETSDQYRAYALDWVNAATDPDAMENRWSSESDLRRQCGWGTDDDDFIRPIYEPKLYEMRKAQRVMN